MNFLPLCVSRPLYAVPWRRDFLKGPRSTKGLHILVLMVHGTLYSRSYKWVMIYDLTATYGVRYNVICNSISSVAMPDTYSNPRSPVPSQKQNTEPTTFPGCTLYILF